VLLAADIEQRNKVTDLKTLPFLKFNTVHCIPKVSHPVITRYHLIDRQQATTYMRLFSVHIQWMCHIVNMMMMITTVF